MTEVRQVLIEAVSKKGTARIGLDPVIAIIEQDKGQRCFVVFPGRNQCRWIFKENDPNFRIIK
ncbi:MAG: hypothetical protein CMK37_07715 [Porticoccaceae bacterium]|nr:hypothetical protein [Porticoccaceae bacterium]